MSDYLSIRKADKEIMLGKIGLKDEKQLYKDIPEELLLNRLTLENTYFFGVHPSNVLPMRGLLPRDKQAMLDAIQEMRAHLGSRLNERPIRTGEGGILNRE